MRKKHLLGLALCSMLLFTVACGDKSVDTNATDNVSVGSQNGDNVSAPRIKGFDFEIPEHFEASTDNPAISNLWQADDHSGSNISYTVFASTTGQNEDFSKETLISTMEEELKAAGYEVDIEVNAYEDFTIDGYKGIRMEISYSYGNKSIHQLEELIITDELIGQVVYSDVDDAGWMDQFKASAATLSIIYENEN